MTKAMEVLLQYAQEQLVRPLMVKNPEYSNIRNCVAQQERAFRALLDEEATEQFEKMMAERSSLDFIYEEALFNAGFIVAMELIR